MQRVENAQKSITDELSLDNQGSALSRLQSMLQENHRQQVDLANKLSNSLELAIAQLQVRRQEADKRTRHGLEFESAVCEQLRSISEAAGDVL